MINSNDPIADYNDQIYSTLRPNSLTDEEISMINFLTEPGSKILDIGGGTGRHAIILDKQKYEVTIIDSSLGMLNQVKKDSNNIKIINDDIYHHNFEKKYDLIILIWNTFNEVALTKENAHRLLLKIKGLLKNGGKVLINIDDAAKVDPSNFEFNITKVIHGKRYEAKWKTLKYFKRTNTSISLEELRVFNNDKLIEKISTTIKQRYWSFKEIQSIAKNLNLSLDLKQAKSNSELYIVLGLNLK